MNKPPESEQVPARGARTPLKLAIDLGPLLLFFGANAAAGIYALPASSWWRHSSRSASPGGGITSFR